MLEAIILFLLWPPSFGQHLTDEAIYTINGKKTLHTVSEKFLSISIDPAVLLTGLNLSETTLQMAKRLSPAYIRIAGPSTQFVKYQDDWNEKENGMLVVTPTMWFGINEWLASANLTPVFGINDRETSKEGWNPQDTMALLDVSDKFNVSCYWQLGYDCSNKSEEQYKNDLRRLQHVLDAFPNQRERWRVVGSDLSLCVNEPRRVLDELKDVLAAVVQESHQTPLLDTFLKPKVPVWMTSVKSAHHVSFASALSWAKELGEAAKVGYEVILRQPRLHEIFSQTPPFWVSFLHKSLMGRHVLEVKTALNHPQLSVYAHCTKYQNGFIRSGAMTVFVVNNCTSNHTVFLKFGTIFMKNTEVQSYILTANSEEATDMYLNGEKLGLDKFAGDKLTVSPKLRRARIMNYLSIFLPPKSVGFFVLPGAQIPVCASEETDLNQIIEEIEEDQNIPFSTEEISVEVPPRFALHKTPSLKELQDVMEKELESDERFYKESKTKKKSHDFFLQKPRTQPTPMKPRQEETREPHIRHRQHKEEEPKRIFELELTSAEIRKVLSDRAKTKAARKNIIFTSEELEEIMDKATQKFLNSKNASIRIRKKSKRDTSRDKKDINMRLLKLKTLGGRKHVLRETLKNRRSKLPPQPPRRSKRDINMELLKLKTEIMQNNHKNKKPKTKFKNKEEKQATIREPGQTSDEFIELEEEAKDSPLPDSDVFAALADPDEMFFTTTTEKYKFKTKSLFNLHKPVMPKIEVKPVRFEPEEKGVFESDFEVNYAPDVEDPEEGFDCIHEFFGKTVKTGDDVKNASELWEVGKLVEKQLNNHLPSLKPRVKDSDVELEERKSYLDEYFDSSKSDYFENDYEDLESDESGPLRLKRGTDDVLGKSHDLVKIDENLKDQQFKLLKERLVYKKKMNFINKNNRYKSLTEGLKPWKPTDILTLKKRSVDHDVDSVENEIENFLKNAEIVKPTLDTEHGDYQLVFPNKDKIEVAENHGETELKLVLHGDGTEKSEEVTKSSNIQKISKKQMDNVWDKLLRKLTKFFKGLSARLKKCIVEDLLK